jgi:hypothetical protein
LSTKTGLVLSCTFIPPQRIALKSVARLSCLWSTLGLKTSFQLRSASLQRIRWIGPLFSFGHLTNVWRVYHPRQRFRPQGLATLSTTLAPTHLEGFFQPTTLVGFSLQSLSPILDRTELSFSSSALALFRETSFAKRRRSSDFFPRISRTICA